MLAVSAWSDALVAVVDGRRGMDDPPFVILVYKKCFALFVFVVHKKYNVIIPSGIPSSSQFANPLGTTSFLL